jgi:uncharacterized protein
MILPLLLLYAYFIEPFWVKTTDYSLVGGIAGEKIVFISDIHYGRHYGKKNLEKLVKKVNTLEPDIVIFGGDYVDHNRKLAPECFSILTQIQAKDGMYGVLGNHDSTRLMKPAVEAGMQSVNIKELDNQGFWVEKNGQRIKIVGVPDYNYGDPDGEKALGDDVNSTDFVVFVSHNPDYFEEFSDARINLYLAGHIHGGQVGLGFWYPLNPSDYGNKYLHGKVKNDNRTIIMSNGIGMSYLPFRFWARPEIVEINFFEVFYSRSNSN